MAIKRKDFNTKGILEYTYPLIEKALKTRYNQWKLCMSKFMQKRSTMLFDTMPCDRIMYDNNDSQELFQALGVTENQILEGIKQTYYWNIESFKPRHAKDPTTIAALCIVRYFMLKKDQKSLDLALVYQSFSGKYYPSIHKGSFPLVTPAKYRHIMEYVINHKLTQKFELKASGSVIGAVKITHNTWFETYKKMIEKFDDEDITYILQQLHNRIKSFMKNIASIYYEAYDNKEFITYDKDSLPEEEGAGAYHLTSNDSFRLQQYVENTLTKINTSQVDYKTCMMCSDANVKTEEVRNIFEAILNNRQNLDLVREYITGMIATYLKQSTNKELGIPFYTYSTAVKPNTKDPIILRMKEIIETLLDDNSVSYRKRKHRTPTKASYHKAFAIYFAVTIINANK